jgi:hypothetical protein
MAATGGVAVDLTGLRNGNLKFTSILIYLNLKTDIWKCHLLENLQVCLEQLGNVNFFFNYKFYDLKYR